MLSQVEQSIPSLPKIADSKKKSSLGQFFTPAGIARFMAGLFVNGSHDKCHLLDAGAGIGSLSSAFLDHWLSGGFDFQRVELDAFEVDNSLYFDLTQTLDKYKKHPNFSFKVRSTDFINASSEWLCGNLFAEEIPKYTHAILNPPYKKIRSDSAHRAALRRAGIETVNLYSAFVALSLALLDDRGQLVAIIPRSFCNGPYYRPFRNFLLERAAIHHIHLFESRNKAFKHDDVLQENIIIRLERGGEQGKVAISTSNDDGFTDLNIREYPFGRIVLPDDPEKFIRAPTSSKTNIIESRSAIRHSLTDIDIDVSTGPVVDFRLKEHLREMPEADTAPLLYPGHFKNGVAEWPKPELKKPNAIHRNNDTEKWLYPNDFYCVVRRFSSKEEKRRVVASVVDPNKFPNEPLLGFENHLNVFHDDKRGLPRTLAHGLAAFLNTTAVDDHFRAFNGHTQVNATDLKQMRYPSRDALTALGEWALKQGELTQEMIDKQLEMISA